MNVTQYDIRFTTKTPPHNELAMVDAFAVRSCF